MPGLNSLYIHVETNLYCLANLNQLIFVYIFFLPLTLYFINSISQIDTELTEIRKKVVKKKSDLCLISLLLGLSIRLAQK